MAPTDGGSDVSSANPPAPTQTPLGQPRGGWRDVLAGFGAFFGKHPTVSFLVAGGLLAIAVLVPLRVQPTLHDTTGVAYFLAAVDLLFVLFGMGYSLQNGGSGLSKLLVGQDVRTSTSKTTYIFWTGGVAFAFGYIINRSFFTQQAISCAANATKNCVPTGTVWEQYLILLGVPAGAAVVAKGIATAKDLSGSIQQVGGGNPSLSDLGTDSTGQTDIADVQYLVFNLIAFIYFLVQFFKTGSFPSVPDMLLGLTSASAAAYTTNKALIQNRPVIRSVAPRAITAGNPVVLTGANLFPDPTVQSVSVSIAGVKLDGIGSGGKQGASSDTLSFSAPAGMSPGQKDVVVITSAGVESDPYNVEIEQPAIVGWVGDVPTAQGAAVLLVSSLPDNSHLQVLVGDTAVEPTADDASRGTISFRLPPSVQAGLVEIAVAADGKPIAGPKQLTVAPPRPRGRGPRA